MISEVYSPPRQRKGAKVHWEYGGRAFCDPRLVDGAVMLTEGMEPDEMVTCKNCLRKWGAQPAPPGAFSSAS